MSDPIYGGDQTNSDANSRVLVAFERLPDRRNTHTFAERARLLDPDIREAMARAARVLANKATQYHQSGFEEDLNDIVYDIAHISPDGGLTREGVPTVVATLRITRNA